jgi:thioredoxin reductase (NADPH)
VRGVDVAASMSEYLVSQLRSTRNVDIRHQVEVTGARSVDGRLSEVEITRRDDGAAEWTPSQGLFVLIGSSPHTAWLDGVVERDEHGFVLVGADATAADGTTDGSGRQPLETTASGVFAIGDTRRGSVKRVATAVGDGAAVVAAVHAHLAPRMVR